eukprot:scaffold32793_cov72-Skeletonema_dohrnii-CCMP3373.AAC.1
MILWRLLSERRYSIRRLLSQKPEKSLLNAPHRSYLDDFHGCTYHLSLATMSSPNINERDGSAELDVALTTEKEAAGISSRTLSLSTSTVGLNPINNEIELRDEAQPVEEVALDEALGDTREGAED